MKKKFFVVIAIIVVLVILLTPVRMNLKDGGSVRYKALVYEVTKIHRLAPEVDGVKPYIDAVSYTHLDVYKRQALWLAMELLSTLSPSSRDRRQ